MTTATTQNCLVYVTEVKSMQLISCFSYELISLAFGWGKVSFENSPCNRCLKTLEHQYEPIKF